MHGEGEGEMKSMGRRVSALCMNEMAENDQTPDMA